MGGQGRGKNHYRRIRSHGPIFDMVMTKLQVSEKKLILHSPLFNKVTL